MNDIMKQMKPVEDMMAKLMEVQNQKKGQEYDGSASGGQVKVVLHYVSMGVYKVKKVHIDKSLISGSDNEILEDLMVAAFNNAVDKANNDSLSNIANLFTRPSN